MNRPKILKTPTPDDISDLLEIHNDMVDLIFEKHADKIHVAAPTMVYILATSARTRGDLDLIISDLNRLFDFQEKERKR